MIVIFITKTCYGNTISGQARQCQHFLHRPFIRSTEYILFYICQNRNDNSRDPRSGALNRSKLFSFPDVVARIVHQTNNYVNLLLFSRHVPAINYLKTLSDSQFNAGVLINFQG